MIALNEMKKCVGEKIKVTFSDGEVMTTYCEEFIPKAEEDEEPMLFVSDKLALYQSEMESIEII